MNEEIIGTLAENDLTLRGASDTPIIITSVQSDWTENDITSGAYIKHKPAIPKASNTPPKMDSSAAIGEESAFARGDHTHPSDTSRVPKTTKINGHALSSDITITASDIGVESGAEVNVLEGVKINGTDLPISNKKVEIPKAGSSQFGLVKTTPQEDALRIDSGSGYVTVPTLDNDGKIDPDLLPTSGVWSATSTSNGTRTLTATTTSGDFVRENGNIVFVRFTYAAVDSISTFTLNVDGTGAYQVFGTGSTGTVGSGWAGFETVGFVYLSLGGGGYYMIEGGRATTSVYGATMLSSSHASTDESIAATPKAVKDAYDLADSKSVVSFSQTQTSGAEVGEITIDGQTTKMFAPSGGGGSYVLTYDPLSSVGSAEIGEAVTGTPNYTPAGEVVFTTQDVNVATSAELDYHVVGNVLFLDGVLSKTRTIKVPTAATFIGTDVTFAIQEEE